MEDLKEVGIQGFGWVLPNEEFHGLVGAGRWPNGAFVYQTSDSQGTCQLHYCKLMPGVPAEEPRAQTPGAATAKKRRFTLTVGKKQAHGASKSGGYMPCLDKEYMQKREQERKEEQQKQWREEASRLPLPA